MIALLVLAAAPLAPAARGEALFARHCIACHGEGGWGTRRLATRLAPSQPALLARRRDLDPDYVRAVVRRGIGPMPPFTPTELSAAELDSLAAFLTRKDRP